MHPDPTDRTLPCRPSRPLPRCRRRWLLPPACGLLLAVGGAWSPTSAAPGETAAEQTVPERGTADERSAAVAERLMTALGGRETWDRTRFISFGFAGRRSHWWDKHTGRHRLEGQDREGRRYVVLHDVVSREGRAWLDGEPLEGDPLAEMLENAYGAWINDTYWLAAPYKLRDPGVRLAWEREETIDGRTHDVVRLEFGEVGLTPGDRYWMFVDRDSGLVSRWAYVLEHQPADAEPTVWRWEGWQRYGEVMLTPERYRMGDDRNLSLAPIAVWDQLDDRIFEQPDAMPPAGGAEPEGEAQ